VGHRISYCRNLACTVAARRTGVARVLTEHIQHITEVEANRTHKQVHLRTPKASLKCRLRLDDEVRDRPTTMQPELDRLGAFPRHSKPRYARLLCAAPQLALDRRRPRPLQQAPKPCPTQQASVRLHLALVCTKVNAHGVQLRRL
jgi:hypothetical protein